MHSVHTFPPYYPTTRSMFQISHPFSITLVIPENTYNCEAPVTFRNELIFYGEESLAPRPNTKLEDHLLFVVCIA